MSPLARDPRPPLTPPLAPRRRPLTTPLAAGREISPGAARVRQARGGPRGPSQAPRAGPLKRNYRTPQRYAHIADYALRDAVNLTSKAIVRAGQDGTSRFAGPASRGPPLGAGPRRQASAGAPVQTRDAAVHLAKGAHGGGLLGRAAYL